MTQRKKSKPKAASAPQGDTKAVMAAEAPETQESSDRAAQVFPIVGIGASAGGLTAFESFFSGMPADSDPGMAFVLVQHLAPDHKSLLSDLVRRYTRMKVFEVEDGMVVHPNCAYIIPPNRDMAFLNGALQLLEPAAPRGQRLPIDFFFRSLAQDQHERAIGVVLSGTGSDGTLGVRDIKSEGGMVMAQRPDSTEYDGMPRSAIATGLVDYVLSPDEMPAHIIVYTAHAFGRIPRQTPAPKDENALKRLFILLRTQTGHDFSQYKPNTIQRRVERRMAIHQINSPEEYVKYLQQTPTEVDALFRDLMIGVTRFFRDPEAFQALDEQVISRLFAGKSAGSQIRVWAPGCSTGEEAYSLAILLAEHQETLKKNVKIQIFATDIDTRAITTARAGIYSASIAADISAERLAHFFLADSDSAAGSPSAFHIQKTLRDMLVFSEQNVIKDPPFSKLDLISCRNLLIYMSSDLQKKLIPLFHYALNPGGFLFLGTSETVGTFNELFTVVDRKLKLYQRKEDLSARQRVAPGWFLPPMTAIETVIPQTAGNRAGTEKLSLRDLAERTLLQQAIPSAALVNGQGDILYIHGRTGMYLEPSPGGAGVNNILKMAREGLRRDLTTALHKAANCREAVHCPNLRVKTNGDLTAVDLTICPVTTDHSATTEPPLYLVILALARPAQQGGPLPAGKATDGSETPDTAARIATLEQELRAREEYLQTTTEELETSNEELKSSNEEMQSINEELQSTNEELETSKEEMQSVNEELSTVNAELETKVAELSQANNDMNNLLAGTGIATVFVDTRLRILRFTPTATRIINLIQSDIGRPVSHIASNLADYDTLIADTQAVLDTLVSKKLDVQTTEGKWFTMRIQPYRTLNNVIEGVVLTFVEITKAREIQNALRLNEERMRVALKAFPAIVCNQDKALRYTWVYNPHPGFVDEQILGKTDADLLPQEDAVKLTAIKQGVLESGVGTRRKVRITIDGKPCFYDLTVEPLHDAAGEIIGVTCASIDITGREENHGEKG